MPFAPLARVCVTTAIGVFAALLTAANWPDPNDTLAGVVIGMVGTYGGFVVGAIWSEVAESRKER